MASSVNLPSFKAAGRHARQPTGLDTRAKLSRGDAKTSAISARQRAGLDALAALAQHNWAASPTAMQPALREPASPIPSRESRSQRPHHRSSKILAVSVIGLTVAGIWLVVSWPPMRYAVYVAWVMPLVELALLICGQIYFRYGYREARPGIFRHLIIQITTTGREQVRVSEIIRQIRDYQLTMDYEIWVVTEPGTPTEYPLADRVLTVPHNFTAKSQKKARALEYSRRVRKSMGLERGDVKILFNDDDVTLTRGYIERAFAADYDICEGIVTPRTSYAVRPFGHFAVSHADDIRTHACLVYCSVFQGILRHPLHVHGEGMTVTGEAEGLITWDIPLVASEDLAFGQRAARRRTGLQWGWFHEYAEVTSPWTLRDFIVQRSRWLWGDIHAIGHRDVMPLSAAFRVVAKYVLGVLGLICSAVGLYLRLSGRIPATSPVLNYAKLALLAWVAVIFSCGWIGAGSATSTYNDDSRLIAGVVAVLMMPLSVALTFAAIVVPLIQGDPRTFRVIAKTRGNR
jgi:Glycosyl transferase family group 2